MRGARGQARALFSLQRVALGAEQRRLGATPMHQEDFRVGGSNAYPLGWYREEARRRWSFSSDGDGSDDDDRDASGSF